MSFVLLGASVTFTVTDSVTGQPVQNALCTVYQGVDFLGEGAYAYTNASGVCFVNLGLTIGSWRVTKTGYTSQQGTYPSSTVSVSFIPTTPTYPVNVSAGWGTGSGTASATLNGVTVDTGGIIYSPLNGSLVVTAHPASGSTFQKWRVNDVDQGSANPQTFIITGAADIEVWFTGGDGGGDGGGAKTKTYSLLSSFGLNANILTESVWANRPVSIQFDAAKTVITSAVLNTNASSNTSARVLEMYVNNADVGGIGFPEGSDPTIPQTKNIDVLSQLINGDNVIGFNYYVSWGINMIGMTCTITSNLVLTYTGDEPTIVVKPPPFDWEKYLPWIIGGGAVLVGLVLLTGRGGGGGQGVTLNIREPARRVYQSIRKRAKK